MGAQKAATTGLFHTLAQHPDVVAPRTDEATILHAGTQDWAPWVEKYEPDLPEVGAGGVLLVKLATAMHFVNTLKTIRELNGDAKIIAILRHPVDRMLSLHHFATQHGMETRPLEVALCSDRVEHAHRWRLASYSGGSRYADAIAKIGGLFPRQNVLYLDYATVHENDSIELGQRFIGVPAIAIANVRANETRAPRSATVARLTNAEATRALARAAIPARWRSAMRTTMTRINSTAAPPPPATLSSSFRADLLERHMVDVEAAERALGKELPHWRV